MAPNIGDSIKNAVEGAVDAVRDAAENLVDKVKGRSDDSPAETETVATEDLTPADKPTPMVVETAGISEPLEFEREDTDGKTRSLIFEPADGSDVDRSPVDGRHVDGPIVDHPTTR